MAPDFFPRYTNEEINERISRQIEANVIFYASQDRASLDGRLQALDREWDIARVLEASAAAVSLIGLGLGRFLSRRWYVLPLAGSAFLLQHVIHGWCPPITLLRRLGVRTSQEIDHERYALKALRGDFSLVAQDSPSVEDALRAVGNS
jgi:hypothetical protein